ncbi:uncharacterized protein [Venturia canescens]|uniref:uncharacterized protein n=1 Tax=Venturia canescens TaxID=32260 RepID=UPI001C9C1464|nr:uncharacterized protein LOC122406725 [Venturia canescens]
MQAIADYARQLLLDQAKINSFITYLKGFWLRNADTVSMFGSSIRTNNIAESCHRHILRRLGDIHPSISMFIPRLANYIKKTELDWQEMDQGGATLLPPSSYTTIKRSAYSALTGDATIESDKHFRFPHYECTP